MPAENEFDPDVFHGELTANRAQVFVRAERPVELADCTLHGFVHGPRCELAHTLPAKFVLKDLGAGPTLLARATLTDPCLWTGDLPQIYDVQIELRRGSEVVAGEQRMIGLRGIGTRVSGETSQLIRESKAWVPRGVALECLTANLAIKQLREELLAVVCTAPPLDLLVEASRRGVYVIANIDATRYDVPSTLRSFARWPAVLMVVIRGGESLARNLQQVAPNLLLAQAIPAAALSDLTPAPWAAAIVVELASAATGLEFNTQVTQPLFIQRPATSNTILPEQARAECDRLQRELAAVSQFSGYLLGPPALVGG